MNHLFFTALFLLLFGITKAQTNSITVPNSGADNSVPPSNINPLPGTIPPPANPSNSTVPGATGNYSVAPTTPDMTAPPRNNSYSISPSPVPNTAPNSPRTSPKNN